MDGHRRYADEPEPSWYTGAGQHAAPARTPYESGVHERPSGAFRLPDPDPATTGGHSAASTSAVRGPEYPPVRPRSAPPSAVAEPTRQVPVPTPPPAPAPVERVYRSRRPVSALLVAAGTGVLMIPVIMLLIQATFDGDVTARGVVPAVLLALGLPLAGTGLYALAGGGPVGRDAWLRPPAVYLPVGLVLLLAAGLAVA